MDRLPFMLLRFAALIPAIMIHEIAHGAAALWCGDTTARDAGRLSFNPLRHADPDISADIDHRGIGGLGILMVKKMMDDVSYEYADGRNILTVLKHK